MRCSQPGDVYSYGIILSELLNREEPYSSLCMEPRGEFFTIMKFILIINASALIPANHTK